MAIGKSEQAKRTDQERGPGAKPLPGMADVLAGETGTFIADLKPYLPQELVGGSVPHIPGTEDEAIWNAASQACGTEKVHYCYTIDEGKIWYLACPSSALASNPDSWCPLAAALPGNSEYWDQETVYLYEQEGVASAMRWDPDTHRIQVFLGASRTILPRIQSMDANFVTISPEIADVVPWQNRNLKTEKLSRATAKMLVVTGVAVAIFAVLVLVMSFVSVNIIERDLEKIRQDTDQASLQIIREANTMLKSDTTRHMVRIQELLDGLSRVDGTLVKYEVTKGKVEWQALIPPAFVQPVMQRFPARVDEGNTSRDGRIRIIGTR